jgi:iron complex outermembrane receptor protein
MPFFLPRLRLPCARRLAGRHFPPGCVAAAVALLSLPSLAEELGKLPTVTARGERLADDQVLTAGKTATALSESPRAVSAVTDRDIEARGATTVMQALEYTPGVYGSSYASAALTREYPLVRGFLAYQFLDGLKLHDSNWGEEVYGLERVELLRGPASSLYGQGSPGGLIDMRSKRPSAVAARRAELRVGSKQLRQGQFDLTGPLSDTLQYRLVGLVRESDGEIDHTQNDRRYLYGALAWQPTSATRLTVMASYQADPGLTVHQPLPRAGTLLPGPDGRFIARKLFLGEPNRHDSNKESWRIGYELSHRIDGTWSFEQNLGYRKINIGVDEVQARGAAAGSTGWVRQLFAARYEIETMQVDNRLVARLQTGAVSHRLMAGFDYASIPNYQGSGTNRASPYAIDLYSPVYGMLTPANPITSKRDQRVRQAGLYLQDQLAFGRTTLLAGVRHDKTALDQRTATLNAGTGQFNDPPYVTRRDSANTAQLGITHALDGGWSPYANYAGSFAPVTGSNAAGDPFVPQRGRQVEAGIKWLPAQGRLSATAALYRIEQRHVLTQDLANPGFAVQSGSVRTRGIELEGRARLWQGADATLGYTTVNAEVTATNTPGGVGKRPVSIPRNQASAWLTQRIGLDTLGALSVSAGVRRMGAMAGDTLNTFDVPSVTLYDLALRWRLDSGAPALRGWELALVARNLGDKRYVANCDAATACYYGIGRSVTATLGASF